MNMYKEVIAMSDEDLLFPWKFETEDVDEKTKWWGVMPNGGPILIAKFAVPVQPRLINFLEIISAAFVDATARKANSV